MGNLFGAEETFDLFYMKNPFSIFLLSVKLTMFAKFLIELGHPTEEDYSGVSLVEVSKSIIDRLTLQ